MHNFRDLLVWQKAVDLTVEVYRTCRQFPEIEKFYLVSQMQRSAVSIASNIVEGAGRQSNNLFKQFLSVALGSCYELETQLIISNKLAYLNEEEFRMLSGKVVEVQRMIAGLQQSF